MCVWASAWMRGDKIRGFFGQHRAVFRPYSGRLRRGPGETDGEHGKPKNRAEREPANPKTGGFVLQARASSVLSAGRLMCARDVRRMCWLGPVNAIGVCAARQSRVAASLKMLPAGFLGSMAAPGRRRIRA